MHKSAQTPKHTRAHTQAGMQTHVQAPMPANESFFTDAMPLPSSDREPSVVGQDPERSSGPENEKNTQPPNATLHLGSATFRGLPPSVSPYTSAVSVVMAADANGAVPDAAMLTVPASCALDGLVIVNENAYCVPASTVLPVCTVSLSVPELKAPFPCVAPSENRSAPLFPTLVSTRLGVSGAFVIPDIVTTELSVAAKYQFVWIVTVMVFDSPASGLLWPILRTSNSGAWRRVVSLCQSTARAMRVRSVCVSVCVCLKREEGECVKGGWD
jgi:hypothetical protein